MPTRKDKTNVTPIYREQVFIPASGATLMKQKARPKINGRPVSSGAIEIVSPEFDLLTGARGLLNMVKPNRVYANIGNSSNMTMFDGATTTNEAVKQGIKEARDYVRHPVIVETVERNKELAERISGKPARNMGWFTDGNRVPANTRAEVLQHYIDRPVHIQTSNDLPKGFLGDYTSANTRIRVKSGLSPYDTKRVTFHEGLHHSGYGNFEGGIYDLKAEKLFGIDDYLLGHEAAVNTAELGRMMGLELGQKYPGLQTFKDMITKYNVDGFDKKFIFDKAILNTPRDYKRFWDALTGKYFTTAGAAATGLNLINTDKMKCGGRRKAQLGLDIREGGIAIPIAPNMYYMNGRSHDEGGIGIGPNNKNGLEVEGGEVVKVGDRDIKVFSSVPLLRGVSPAQLVMGGANPNAVFKAQEAFKDKNRIKDNGTRYQNGGNKVIKYENLPNIFKGKRVNGRVLQGGVPPILSRGEFAMGNPIQRMSMWNDDLGEFSKYIGKSIHKYIPKKLDLPYRYVADYFSNKGPNNAINNNAENLTKAVSLFNAHEYKYGGNMIYEINGNVKNELMSSRPKAQYGLASKYLKKRNKTIQKPVETKQKEEPKILDIRNTAGYKVKQIAENPWVKYPVEVASYLLTGATAKSMQTGTKIASKAVNKIDDILGKPRQEYLSRNVSDKTIKVGTIENPIRPKDSSRITKVYKPTINEISQARQAARPKKESKIKSIDKIYKQVIGNKKPRSTVGNIPQWTEISYNPTNRTVTAYDASAEFHKRISDMLYDSYVKKYGKKAVDKAMKAERISKYEYGGRIKAKDGKFLKYKNGIYTDPETGEEFDVDPEVFKMYGNTKESGVIPTNDYTKGTFDNARPQYYAEKRLPIAGSQSIAEKAGLARSGWSYADNTNVNYNNYVSPKKINIKETPRREGIKLSTIEEDYMTGKRRSANRHPVPDFVGEVNKNKEVNKTNINKSKTTVSKPVQSPLKGADLKYGTPLAEKKESLYITGIKNNIVTPLRAGMEKIPKQPTTINKPNTDNKPKTNNGLKEGEVPVSTSSSSSTGGTKQPNKDGRWIPQFDEMKTRDWIGLGSNLAGHVISYFTNNALLSKYPMPIKPVMAQAAKLKTTHNINPQLTNNREAELTNRSVVRRNTQSSNTSIAREQRIMNEARGARNVLYGQKENIETNLINQDRLNRQSVYQRNIAAYNDWLDKTMVAKTNKWSAKQQNIMNLVNGTPAAVNHVIGTIENRELNNNTIRAIAAANPNVDGRLLGIGDYHTQRLEDGRVAIYDKNGKFIKYQ